MADIPRDAIILVEQEDPNDPRALVAYLMTDDDPGTPVAMLPDGGGIDQFLELIQAGSIQLGLPFALDERETSYDDE